MFFVLICPMFFVGLYIQFNFNFMKSLIHSKLNNFFTSPNYSSAITEVNHSLNRSNAKLNKVREIKSDK